MRWVLWAGTVGLGSPLPDRIDAAVAGGYDLVSMSPVEIAAAGSPLGDLRRRLHDAGLGLVLDPVMGWHADESPAAHALPMREVLRMAEDLRPEAISLIGPFSPGESTTPRLVERFGSICDSAAAMDVRVQIEFMPFSLLRDLRTVWPIVEQAGRENGGIVIDTWHFFRGGPDHALLERIPGDRIFAVQVSDADEEIRGDLAADTFHRKLPGEGKLDIEGLLASLAGKGCLSRVGPEVISPELEAMGPLRAAVVAGERVRAVVAKALAEA